MDTKVKDRSYCFTIFNNKIDDIKYDNELIRYMIVGIEHTKDNKEHLQGYLELHYPQRISRVKKSIGIDSIHLEKRKGTRLEAINYCKKEHKYTEYGTLIKGKGHRSDLDNIKTLIKEGKDNSYILDNKPEYIHRYYKFIKVCREIYEENKNKTILEDRVKDIKLTYLQNYILDKLLNQQNRKITYVVDKVGGRGKSTLCDYILYKYDSILFSNAKTSDIAYSYKGQKYILFDFSRTLEDKINYNVIEQLKNGRIFSSKYESCMKIFNIPNIVIMTNFKPDKSKLSLDRWDIVDVDDMYIINKNITVIRK